jgi:hypothetical protein
MGFEYVIRPDVDRAISDEYLEETLRHLPHYFGRVKYPNDDVFEFRTPYALRDTNSMPDLYVCVNGGDIVLCRFGDRQLAAQVLGTLVSDLIAQSPRERVSVYAAGAETRVER